MICSKCKTDLAEESFECPVCGNELVSRSGVKAIRIIFWALMIIWVIFTIQLEFYTVPPAGETYNNATNIMWSIRCNELTALFILFSLFRYMENKPFFPFILTSFGIYLLTIAWIYQAFANEPANVYDTFLSESHLILRGIFAYIATIFAYFVSKLEVDRTGLSNQGIMGR